MVIRWKDYSPEPPFRIYAMHEAAFFNGLLVLGAMLSPDRPQPDFRAYARGDLNRTLGHFKTLTEAKEAAEKWFRQELLDLDF
jgi:hypothetical protein